MVLATVAEAKPKVVNASRTRSSAKSRCSRRPSRRGKSRVGSWSCCPCPLTVLRGDGGAPCASAGGRDEGGQWPASAKFYCCRADLVAAMAKERANNNETVKATRAAAVDIDDDGILIDYDDDDLDEVAEEALPDSTFREVFDRSHQQDPDEQWQVAEPDLPYVENLPHQLDTGRTIIVDGVVLPDAIGFAINLSCGAGDTPDIALHFNPRLDRSYVARNSRTKGTWGQEEGAALGGAPFKRGQAFVVHILVTATGFKVSVDRMHFCNFQFRMPISKVCRLEIHGDAIISYVKHSRLEVYPDRRHESLPEHTFCSIPTDHAVPWSMDFTEKENLFIGRFKPNLSPGMEITIKGRMKLLPQSFFVNLQQGCQLWPHPNVHFHLNPRFAAEDSDHVVVVNGWMKGSWGSEQRYNRCRFRPGEPFSMVIYVEDQRYRVMVNGLQQAAMFHRAPPSLVDTLVVRGDLFVSHVGIARSCPPVERLPTPCSPSQSSYESFVHIPEDPGFQMPAIPDSHETPASFTSESDILKNSSSGPSYVVSSTPVIVEEVASCTPSSSLTDNTLSNNMSRRETLVKNVEQDEDNSSNVSVQEESRKEQKNMGVDESHDASGS